MKSSLSFLSIVAHYEELVIIFEIQYSLLFAGPLLSRIRFSRFLKMWYIRSNEILKVQKKDLFKKIKHNFRDLISVLNASTSSVAKRVPAD